MIKKTTAILFLILANIIILVHAVVPHHHHFGNEVFSHSSADCCHHEFSLLSLGCENDDCSTNDSENNTCRLQDLLSKLVLNTKERESVAHAVESDYQDYYIASWSLPNTALYLEAKAMMYNPYTFHLPSIQAFAEPSLRAPPSC
jgi:hypothetical protein